MKVRSISLFDHPVLGDLSLDFRDEEGWVQPVTIVQGGNGAGKTAIHSSIGSLLAIGRQPSLVRPFQAVGAKRGRLDVEHNGEIASIQVDGDRVAGGAGWLRESFKLDIDVVSGRSTMEMGVLSYSSDRATRAGVPDFYPLGVKMLAPIFFDLQANLVRDSVILVDDLELGLDEGMQWEVLKHLSKQCRAGGNQLIVTTRCKRGAGGMWSPQVWRHLKGERDPIADTLAALSKSVPNQR